MAPALEKTRKALSAIPPHLVPYTTQQKGEMYSWIDHSVWRFIMSISCDYFAETAHKKYLEGLKETGISIDRIPLVSEMDEKLKRIGWRAVAVSGFIPPAIFLEFMALGIMPIACEIRKLENIAYTPAPDIVHEAAGHAPIVADPDYNEYVRSYGEVAVKAIFSKKDMDLYEAIKALSDVKENPSAKAEEIDCAQKNFEKAFAAVDYISEANHLSRMAWWTIEYGLVGEPNNFKLYGAGLLSSMGESFHCFDQKVVKVPLTIDCVHMGFDITRPQPQLYVASSFESAREVLESYAKTMAFRTGGVQGLSKARIAETTTTSVLDCGLQISGIVSNFGMRGDADITFVDFKGPLQLCENDREIPGCEMAKLPPTLKVILGAKGPQIYGPVEKEIKLNSGALLQWVKGSNGPVLLSSSSRVTSVYGGPADRATFIKATWDGRYQTKDHIPNLSKEESALNDLYLRIRKAREQGANVTELEDIYTELKAKFPKDWLSRYELLEIVLKEPAKGALFSKLMQELSELKKLGSMHQEVIDRGLKFLAKKSPLQSWAAVS